MRPPRRSVERSKGMFLVLENYASVHWQTDEHRVSSDYHSTVRFGHLEEQFSTTWQKMLAGIFSKDALHTGGGLTGELLIADGEDLEKNVASEVHVKRFTSHEVQLNRHLQSKIRILPVQRYRSIKGGYIIPRPHCFRLLQREDQNAGGDSDAQRHPQYPRIAGGDSVAEEAFLPTPQAARRKSCRGERPCLEHIRRFLQPSSR